MSVSVDQWLRCSVSQRVSV